MKHLALISLIALTLISGCKFKPTPQQLENRLQTAIIRGDIDKAKTIINKAESPTELATKLLPIAAVHTGQNRHTQMIKLLVENGGDLNSKQNNSNSSTVIKAIRFRHMTPELLQWCIDKGYDVDLTEKSNRTALAVCMDRIQFEPEQYYQMIRILIDGGADVNISSHGFPVLQRLVIFNESLPEGKELLKLFIEAGADLEAKDKRGKTVLCVALEHGKEDMAELLLEHGASYDTSDEHGTTALFKAAHMGFVTCVEMLIAQGADVNKVNSGGFTPLHFAVSGGNEEIVKMLLDNGAKVNTVNENNQTPLDRADRYTTCRSDAGTDVKKQKLIDLLTQHGAKRATELKETNA